MSNIEFNDNLTSPELGNSRVLYSRLEKGVDRPSLVNFLIKKGIVGSENSANIVLLISSLIFFLTAVFIIYFYFFYTPSPKTIQGESPQVMVMQKIQEYINQGMDPEEARNKAVGEFNLQK